MATVGQCRARAMATRESAWGIFIALADPDPNPYHQPHDATADADLIIDGDRSFGYSLASADLNGDGLDDLLIGSPDIEDPQGLYQDAATLYDRGDGGNGGRVYIFSGASISAGATLDQSNADGRIGTSDTFFFGTDVITGDMNDDGTPDIFVSEPMWESGNGSQEGAVYYFVSP